MPEPSQIAVQLYTLRDFIKTPADIASTFEKLSAQGWRAAEDATMGEIATDELQKIADDAGVSIVAAHTSVDKLEADFQGFVDKYAALGCKQAAVGGFFPSNEEFTADHWNRYIDRFNALVPRLAEAGIGFGYHNHAHEWIRFGDPLSTQRPIDLLLERLHPDANFEIDTYWVAAAGGNPAAWVKRLHGRIPCLHLKDMLVGLDDRKPVMAEVGVGNLDWPSILGAGKDAGVEHYIVEQDRCYRDPFDSLKTSLDNVKAMGLS